MLRKIIQIDKDLCNGCGLCAQACHEGAIGMVDGKAQLLREDYCDGLGDCLPVCPTSAISFVEREAAPFQQAPLACGCPGTQSKIHVRRPVIQPSAQVESELLQWPVQIKLVPINAPYFDDAKLLIAADCTAYAYGPFHSRFMRGRVTLIGCPKLDTGDYTEKLTAILRENNITSVTVVRMEVPCCGGIEQAVQEALKQSGKWIPWQVVAISTDGRILSE